MKVLHKEHPAAVLIKPPRDDLDYNSKIMSTNPGVSLDNG